MSADARAPEQYANARLMAAAPEMFRLLQRLVRAPVTRDIDTEMCRVIEDAEELIKQLGKAEVER